jgi:hypothetical protein
MFPIAAAALFSHLVADNAALYRAILDVFAASKRQFRLRLATGSDARLSELGRLDASRRDGTTGSPLR